MKKHGLLLGIIFVVVGLIVLLKSFGILSFSWWAIWKTWPFAFIFIGIGIMPIKKEWKGIFCILSIMACVATMIYVSQNNHKYGTWKERLLNFFDDENVTELKEDFLQSDYISYFGFSDDITHINVNAEFVSGEYIFETKTYKKMLRLTFQGNEYSSSVTENKTDGFFDLRPKHSENCSGNGTIYLYENFNYTFHLQGRKSNVSLNAENLKIDTLNITADETSTWHITLSNLLPETNVFIKAYSDANNIELTVPASSGYQFTTTALSDDSQWNNMKPIETGTYQSDNFTETKSQVFIHSNTNKVNIQMK